MKITKTELAKLRGKVTDTTKKPEDRIANATRLERLILRRHGVDSTKFEVLLNDGSIRERVKE